jgi:hypothetical protein
MTNASRRPIARSVPQSAKKHRLLLLSCSQRKLDTPGRIAALRRYDGPAFRVLRKYLLSRRDPCLKVLIVSAKYGLIPAEKRISDYDLRLDAHRASSLQRVVTDGLRDARNRVRPESTLLCMSKLYLTCLEETRGMEIASPGQGRKLAHLKAWLYNS